MAGSVISLLKEDEQDYTRHVVGNGIQELTKYNYQIPDPPISMKKYVAVLMNNTRKKVNDNRLIITEAVKSSR